MWAPEGKPIDKKILGTLVPTEVLFEFEEPLTFVCQDPEGQLLLAHSLCAEPDLSRYLVAVTDQEVIDGLKAGRLDVLGALRQPRCWIVDFGRGWETIGIWSVLFDKIPKDLLPRAGAMLTPDLDPFFRVRLVGSGVGPGKTSAADVRRAAQASESGSAGGPECARCEEARDKFRGISAMIPNPPTSWPRLSGAIESGWDTLCRDTGRDIAKHHAPSATIAQSPTVHPGRTLQPIPRRAPSPTRTPPARWAPGATCENHQSRRRGRRYRPC